MRTGRLAFILHRALRPTANLESAAAEFGTSDEALGLTGLFHQRLVAALPADAKLTVTTHKHGLEYRLGLRRVGFWINWSKKTASVAPNRTPERSMPLSEANMDEVVKLALSLL